MRVTLCEVKRDSWKLLYVIDHPDRKRPKNEDKCLIWKPEKPKNRAGKLPRGSYDFDCEQKSLKGLEG